MAEYIDREAISEEIRKYYYKNPPNFPYGEGFDRGLDRAQRAILDAPTADVAPVVHSYWEHKITSCEENISICHNCKYPVSWFWGLSKYCPNCGAKMDGGDSDEAD